MSSLNLNTPLDGERPSDIVPASKADALHIVYELYEVDADAASIRGMRYKIESHEVKAPIHRVNLHRISDAIVIRYPGMESYDAVKRFLTELYDQAIENRLGIAATAAFTLCVMNIDDALMGHNLDNGKRSPRSMARMDDAVEWHIKAIAAEVRGRGGLDTVEMLTDDVADHYSNFSKNSPSVWYLLLKEGAVRMGKDAVDLVDAAVKAFEENRRR